MIIEPIIVFPKTKGINYSLKYFGTPSIAYCSNMGLPRKLAKKMDNLRGIGYNYGIFDIKADNLMRIDGKLKIIDANITPFPLPTVWKIVDETKPKLPKRLMLFTKKVTRLLYDR